MPRLAANREPNSIARQRRLYGRIEMEVPNKIMLAGAGDEIGNEKLACTSIILKAAVMGHGLRKLRDITVMTAFVNDARCGAFSGG